jgi:hypothetical protein
VSRSKCNGHPDIQPPRLNVRSWLTTPDDRKRCTITPEGNAVHNIEVENRNTANSLIVEVKAWSWTNLTSWRRTNDWEEKWLQPAAIISPGSSLLFSAYLRTDFKTNDLPPQHNERIVIEYTWSLIGGNATYWPSFVILVDLVP